MSAAKYDLFISYADADQEWVKGYFLDTLKQAGLRYHSAAAFALGVPRLLEFERAIQQSRRTLLVISRAYMANDLEEFVEVLAASCSLETGNWLVIPLILEPVKLPPRLSMLVSLDATNPDDWDDVIQHLCANLQCRMPGPAAKLHCPYLGMLPFSEADSDRFFGRDREIEEAINRLRIDPFITAIGPSGSGKSSLVFAGLIPALRRSGLFGSGEWLVRTIRPGTTPLSALEAALGSNSANPALAITKALTSQPDAQRLLLVIDQFEEIFTPPKPETVPFQQILLHLIETPNCYLILTVRADFYPDLMESLLWHKIQSHRLEVVPLDAVGLREAIVKPAEHIKVFVESTLVEHLVSDAAGEPGALPLIQETLMLLWEKLKRNFLPLKAYESLVLASTTHKNVDGGHCTGLQIAIANRADAALASLSQEQQQIARRIFLRLIQFGEGRADTRRQQSIEQLQVFNEDTHLFDQTLIYLSDHRLLILSGEEEDASKKVDIAHEALIAGWSALQLWLTERRQAEQTRRLLMHQVEEWVRLGKDSAGLLDQAQLAEAGRWLGSADAEELGYDETLLELVEISDRTIQGKLEHERKLRHKAQRRAIFATALAIVAGIAATGFLVQWSQAIQGEINTLTALSDAYLTENRELEALVASVKAGKKLNMPFVWFLEKVHLLPDHSRIQTVATLTKAVHEVQEFNRLEGHSDIIWSVSFSPDGQKLVSASGDNTIKLWSNGVKAPKSWKGHKDRVTSISFSPNPDDKIIASGSGDHTIKIWNYEGELLWSSKKPHGHELSVRDVSFSHDGEMIASASDDNTVKIWSKDGTLIKTLKGHNGAATSVSFSPDRQILASAGWDKTVRLWNLKNYQNFKTLNHSDLLNSVDFSLDGQIIASAGDAGMIRFWSKDGQEFETDCEVKHNTPVNDLSFGANRQMASAAEDNTVRVWHLNREGRILYCDPPKIFQGYGGLALLVLRKISISWPQSVIIQ